MVGLGEALSVASDILFLGTSFQPEDTGSLLFAAIVATSASAFLAQIIRQ